MPGAISDDEADDLEYTDIVMQGSDPDGNLVHVLIEVSFIIQETDIKRAARRADILERTVAGPARAVVIGEYIFRRSGTGRPGTGGLDIR